MPTTQATPPAQRTAPEWSDVALFAVAVAAIWFLRRALRRRLPRHRNDD
jgi:membrane protein implicated in regulation of membrane protease activity